MNVPTCKRLFLAAFLLLINSIPFLHADATSLESGSTTALPTVNKEMHALVQSAYEAHYSRLLAHMHMLSCIVQDLAFNVSNNTGVDPKRKPTIIKELSATLELLKSLQKLQVVVLDENIINSLITINREIIVQLTDSLKKGMGNYSALDMRKVAFGKNKISSDRFEAELLKNESLIKQLEPLANNLGLRWYNKLYRTFKRVFVEPARIAYIPALCVSAVGTAAFFAWYYFGGENPKWLRNKVGWPAQSASTFITNDPNEFSDAQKHRLNAVADLCVRKAMQENATEQEIATLAGIAAKQTVDRPVGWFGRLEHRIAGINMGQFVIGSTLMGVGLSQTKRLLTPLSEWAGNKLKRIDNFLLGGAYKNKQVEEFSWRTDITCDDMIGNEEVKQYIFEVIQYLKNPEAFDRAQIAPPRGAIFKGPSRSGKSNAILALQGEIQRALGSEATNYKLWKIPFNDLVKYSIQDLMDAARSFAPCIVVIEEIDLLGLQRVGNTERLANWLTALSSCMQDNKLDKHVIIIGTTTNITNLDHALLQPGRFGTIIDFKYPNLEERKIFITRELARTGCSLHEFDLDKLAAETEDCSFEKLSLFIKRTFLHAKLYGKLITQDTFEQSIDENIRGITRNPITMSTEQQKIVAAHLAGHTIANMILDSQTRIAKITLKDIASTIEETHAWMDIINKNKDGKQAKQAPIEHGKIFLSRSCDITEIESAAEKIKQCKIALAGHAAEKLMLGGCGYSYHPHDKQVALDILKSLEFAGIDPAGLSKEDREKRMKHATELLDTCEQEITKLLDEHRKELTAVMNALVEQESKTLDAHQLSMLVFGFDKAAPQPLDSTKMLEDLLKGNKTAALEVQPAEMKTAAAAA